MAIETNAERAPVVIGSNSIVKVVLLDPLIGVFGFATKVKSNVCPVSTTYGFAPSSVKSAFPLFSMVNVLLITVPLSVEPKFVLLENDGLFPPPSVIAFEPLSTISISGAGTGIVPFPIMSNV